MCYASEIYVHFKECSREKMSSVDPVELESRRVQTAEVIALLRAAATAHASAGGDPVQLEPMALSSLGFDMNT
jgi:hypothetical protein